MSAEELKENCVASVHYTGTLPDTGEMFDTSEGGDPLTFLVGHQQMIPGFEEEMLGAKIGERREFTLEPERAYGHRDDDALLEIPRENFAQLEQDSGESLEVGMQLVAQMPHGPAPFTITALTDELVSADFNHAMAGKSLTFSVEVVELRDATDEEIAHGHVHGPGGHHH